MPELRSRFVAYGSRATQVENRERDGTEQSSSERSSRGLLLRFLDELGSIQAPHGYFKHFYIISVLSSIFWGIQILGHGSVLKQFARLADTSDSTMSMSMNQITLLWSLMLIQGIRRLVESIFVMKTSASSMWFLHYIVGASFYLIMGVAVWIEGAGKLRFSLKYPNIRLDCIRSKRRLNISFEQTRFCLRSHHCENSRLPRFPSVRCSAYHYSSSPQASNTIAMHTWPHYPNTHCRIIPFSRSLYVLTTLQSA